MDISKENKLSELIMRHLQGDNSPQELQQLKKMLQDDVEAVELYVDYMMQFSALNQPGKIRIEDLSEEPSPSLLDTSLWMALSKYEMEAPEIDLPKDQRHQELIQKVVYPPKEKRALNKWGIGTLIFSAAAVIILILYVRFAPPKEGGVEVATLADSINAKWADAGISMQKGTRFFSGRKPFLLREGLLEIKFDNNTKVTIEGPAEFQILDGDMVKLNYGRLYSHVPAEAYGFQVCTPHAKIIDLGTEFGVTEGFDGDTEVHVFKGKVNLISSALSKKINVDILAGSARELDVATGILKEIPCQDDLFARQIDSGTNIIWRGQKTLDLADIVGGGNGLGTGEIGKGVSLAKGSFVSDYNWSHGRGKGQYLNVKELPFVDGVIVPDSEDGTLQVSSDGHIFRECPNTNGLYYDDIRNGGLIHMSEPKSLLPMLFNGVTYGTAEQPLLFMNSNACITFDLDAIRVSMPGIHLASFRSRCFLFERSKPRVEKTDIFVLVDGEEKFSKIGFDQNGIALNINIPLMESDRFLTLMATDGGDGNAIDWVGFAEPYVFLETDR